MTYTMDGAMGEIGAQDSIGFGRMLQEQRKAAGKSQAQVAKEVGTRRQTIADLEGGKNVGMHIAFGALAAIGRAVKVYELKRPDMNETNDLQQEAAMREEGNAKKELAARDVEAVMLARCVAVAKANHEAANDQKEANVFRLASMVVENRYPSEARRLRAVSNDYFGRHPEEKLLAGDVVSKGWVWGLPRLRDMLSRELAGAS